MGSFLTKPAQGHVFHNVFHICGNLGGETEPLSPISPVRAPATVAQSVRVERSDPLTALKLPTSIEVSFDCHEGLWLVRTRHTHEGKADISTQRSSAQENTRFSRADGHEERSHRAETAPSKRAETPHGGRRALVSESGPRTGARRAGPPTA